MSVFDHEIQNGQEIPFDESYHNALVKKLKAFEQASQIRLQKSSSRAEVHPTLSEDGDNTNDYPLEPNAIAISDITRWGSPAESEIKIVWKLEKGPGHLETGSNPAPAKRVETTPGDTIFWSWDRANSDSYYNNRPDRDWDALVGGKRLPASVQIKALAKALTLETNGDPVASVGDLSTIDSPADGERRLVRQESAIYTYDAAGDSWGKSSDVASSDYALISSDISHHIVSRAYDPTASPEVVPNIETHQDVAYISAEGTAEIGFNDFTSFGDETSVSRDIYASLKNGDGSNVEIIGRATEAPNNITTEDQEDLVFFANVSAPGVLLVAVDYDIGGKEVKRTVEQVRVRPSLDTSLGATTDPAIPPINMQPGEGQVLAEIGKTVSPENVTNEGTVFDENAKNKWTDDRARELTRRLGVQDLTDEDPQVQRLYEAGTLLVSALHQPTENGLRRYELDLLAGDGSSGQVLLFGSDFGALRLKDKTGGTAEEGELQRWTAVGRIDRTTSVPDAHLTGNGSRFEIDVRLAYGTASSGDFPEKTFLQTIQVRPGQERSQITLPRKLPNTSSDKWHYSYRVKARWESGREVSSEYSPWRTAEKLPSSAAAAELVAENSGLTLSLDTEGEAHGIVQWGPKGNNALNDEDVAGSSAIPNNLPVNTPPKQWQNPQNPPHLYVKLLQLAPGGSSRGQIESFDLSVPSDSSNHVLPVSPLADQSNTIPAEWPVVNGMLIQGETKNWIGIGDQYVLLGGGATGLLGRVDVVVDGTVLEDISSQSPVEYEQDIDFYNANTIEVRLHTVGVVDNVRQMSDRYTLIQPQSMTPAFNENGGYYSQTFDVKSGGYGKEDALLYRIGAGTDKQIVEVNLPNNSFEGDDGPSILTVDPLIDGAPEINVSQDRSQDPTRWTLKLQDGEFDWQGAYVTVTTEGVGAVDIDSVTVPGGTVSLEPDDVRLSDDVEPQRLFLNLSHSSFENGNVTISLTLKQSNSTGAPRQSYDLLFEQA